MRERVEGLEAINAEWQRHLKKKIGLGLMVYEENFNNNNSRVLLKMDKR